MFDIKNDEAGELTLQSLSLKPTFGMIGAGEPVDRTAKRVLERLQDTKVFGRKLYFLQEGIYQGLPLPKVQVEGFFIGTFSVREETYLSCLDVVWLVDDIFQLFPNEVVSLFESLKWSDFCAPFEF